MKKYTLTKSKETNRHDPAVLEKRLWINYCETQEKFMLAAWKGNIKASTWDKISLSNSNDFDHIVDFLLEPEWV